MTLQDLSTILNVGSVIGGAIALLLLFPLFYPHGTFWETLRFLLQPDWISWMKNERGEDFFATFEFYFWLFSGCFIGFLIRYGLGKLLDCPL